MYRLAILYGEVDKDDGVVVKVGRQWAGEKWWYKLAHVCQRWRNLVLRSVSYLGLCLVCTSGTPVADMLDHSPPLPLIIDYDEEEDDDITAEDEEGIILSLWSIVIASTASAFGCLFKHYRNSSWPSTRNIQF
jgi:hypothetical protein